MLDTDGFRTADRPAMPLHLDNLSFPVASSTHCHFCRETEKEGHLHAFFTLKDDAYTNRAVTESDIVLKWLGTMVIPCFVLFF